MGKKVLFGGLNSEKDWVVGSYWWGIKVTVSVISSDPSCKDDNARFKTVPLKFWTDQLCGWYCRFSRFKRVSSWLFMWVYFLQTTVEMRKSLFSIKNHIWKWTVFKIVSNYFYFTFKGIVTNPALSSLRVRSFEITLTCPFKWKCVQWGGGLQGVK